MDKKKLQLDILEKPYQPKEWVEVLRRYFGAKKFYEPPRKIEYTNADWIEHVNTAFELGSFYTADERLIGIYEINLTAKAWISKNKVGLRNLLRQVYDYDVDGALIVFVQGEKWRFSYVSEIRTEEGKKETEPKRYTYLFGKGESCRTAADRFDKLKDKPVYLNDLFDAFSVEKLNKDFFKSYKDYFELFSDYLAKQINYRQLLLGSSAELEKGWKDEKAKPIRNFAKRLLGRIVFLQFLQKKGWMGVPATSKDWINGDPKFLQNLFLTFPDPAHFHSKALRSLFFKTLNDKRPNHLAPALLGGNIKIPYLNGGLFDKDISFENDIDFPIDLFRNLLDFFEQYNFTIDENDPYDSEVGIDPEMLGHIFENLLEENKDKGAFYTPKEIVHYMCQESLIEYLHTQMPDCAKEDFEMLVRNNKVADAFTPYKKANEINEKLKSVKICDPAIGSGAFPMGLLKEIFECRRLLYGYLKTNDAFDPASVKKEIIQQNIYGVDIENGAVEIARLRFWLALVVDEKIPQPLPNLDYKIMQGNSLLEQFANIQLDKLINAGDEVMVHERRQLTLGGDFEPVKKQLTIFSQANKEHLYLLIKKYFDPDAWEEKTGERIEKSVVKREINDFVEGKIHAHVLKQQRKLNEDIKVLEKKWRDAGVKDFEALNQKTKEYKLYGAWKDQLEQLGETEEKLIALQKTEDKPYFLWHLWFKDVFDMGGFDIVIGNPPFIQMQKLDAYSEVLQKANYETFTKTGDVYCLFYEQGNNLLKPSGTLCYISSNTWMRTKFGELLRDYFVRKTNPIILINFEDTRIFQTATVETNIFLSQKANFRNVLEAVAIKSDYSVNTSIVDYFSNNKIQVNELPREGWVIISKKDYEIKRAIESRGKQLKFWDIQINFGFKTGFNEPFFIDGKKRNELILQDENSDKIIKPLLRGRDIKKYTYEFNDEYVIWTHNGVKGNEKNGRQSIPKIDVEKDYKAVYQHLLKYKDKDSPLAIRNVDGTYKTLIDRTDQGSHWTNLRDCSFAHLFEKPKLIWLGITDTPTFAYDEKHYITNPANFLSGENLKYLLAILNSKVIEWYLDKITSSTGQGTNQWKKMYVELLPIPEIRNENEKRKFEIIVDYLIFLNDKDKSAVNPYTDNSRISPVFEDLQNMMVYELYFEQHMKEEDIDVLMFVDENHFPKLSDNDSINAEIIGSAYKWLQEQENPIRNRIILSNIRSKDIIGRINKTTH